MAGSDASTLRQPSQCLPMSNAMRTKVATPIMTRTNVSTNIATLTDLLSALRANFEHIKSYELLEEVTHLGCELV